MKNYLFIRNLFDAPKNYYNSIVLNFFGLQVIRYLFHNMIHFIIKQIKYSLNEKNKEILDLKNNGITVIENCFEENEFNLVKKIFEKEIIKVNKLVNKDNSGIDWSILTFDSETENSDLQEVYETIFNNKKIKKIISNALKIKDLGKPMIGFQMLENPISNEDNKDIQLALHSDRFYPCYKLYLSIDDNNIENGAYRYSRKSHKFSLKRVAHEYEYSIRNSLFNSGFDLKNNVEFSRCVPNKNIFSLLYKNTESIVTKKNSVVISNNKGFHSRGKMNKGSKRKQIRIVYYYLQRSMFYDFLKKIYNSYFKN